MTFSIRDYLGITGDSPVIKHDNVANPIPHGLLNTIDSCVNELICRIAGPPKIGPPATTAAGIKDQLNQVIAAMGLGCFYPPDHPRIAELAANAEKVIKEGTAPLSKPEHAAAITYFCLYDVYIYLDDSYSMTTDPNRIPAQTAFAKRVSDIIFPYGGNTQTTVRFINDPKKWENLTTGDAVAAAVKSVAYTGYTPIGAQLKNKILQPAVYDRLAAGTYKPVFIIVVTDGSPYKEPVDLFRDNIVAANEAVKAKYGSYRRSLRYNINQIGHAAEAEAFIKTLLNDPLLSKNVHITAEKLDAQIAQLAQNKQNLETWMFDVLFQRSYVDALTPDYA